MKFINTLIFVGFNAGIYYYFGFFEFGELKGDLILTLNLLVELFYDPESNLGNSFADILE